jgi:two-component system invasion response regulator UvrY
MIRVVIADDHAIVRQGLKQILSEIPDMTLAGEAVDGQEALNRALAEGVDVLVLDITMPGRGGFDILKELKHERPGLPVLVMSVHDEAQFGPRMLKAGASGYIAKDSLPDELVRAIRRVVDGGKYISQRLAEILTVRLGAEADGPPHATLSDREFQVVRMMGAGKTATEIAEALALSVKTVSTYRARILEKLDLTTSAEIVRYALQNQLIN